MPSRWLIAIAVAALHGTLLLVYWWPEAKQLVGDEALYLRTAKAIVAGRDVSPPLLWPPFYADFVAWILWLGGSLLGVQLVQTALLFGCAALARDGVTRLVGPGVAADGTALLFVAYPPLIGFAHYLWPEVLHLAFWIAALWILIARRESWLWLAALGVVLGLAFLTKTLLAPFLPVLLLPLVWRGSTRDRVLRAGLVVAVSGLVVAPTLVRNYERHGVVTIANSGWFNLWVGLNEISRTEFEQSIVGGEYRRFQRSAATFPERNAILREKTLTLVRERGVARVLGDQLGRQYFRLFDKDSFLTGQLPGGAVHRMGGGYRDPPAAASWLVRVLSYGTYAALLVGTAAGLALLSVRDRPWVGIVWSFLAYNLLLMLFLHVKTRYRVQLMPFAFFLSAYAFSRWTAPPHELGLPPRALAAAGAGGALLLFLAFG